MGVFFFILLAPFILPLLRVLLQKKDFEKSAYQQTSGNTLWETFFNKGNLGEYYTFKTLEQMGKKSILTNIYIPQEDASTTEIDLLMIDTTGIYVFESKNYSGWIFGNERNKMWTQTFKRGKKFQFYNPIWQNKGHISALDSFLGYKYTKAFFSYIIFSERCQLKDVKYTSTNVAVLKREDLPQLLRSTVTNRPEILTEDEVDEIYFKLKEQILADEATKQKHIQEVRAKHNL